ncbi:hypothetical protein [Aromatoleum evansii]|uniref:hypothetical protein n=1 Tax=Aromatoleum evansii TaxID=59406 RepID=UPI00145F939C|nr:hypothetical protein [Aromatoleum evansii]NMG31836.1 hypothetical protein [Aromatoleum evansii]
MPILAPLFREVNHNRIDQLHEAGLTPQTIASVICDETKSQVKLTASDVRSYLKVQDAAAKQMLISQRTMRALLKEPQLGVKPA